MLSPLGADQRLHLPPHVLGRNILLVAQLPAELCQGLGLLIPSEHAERAPELLRVGRERRTHTALLQPVAVHAPIAGSLLVIARQRRDLSQHPLAALVASELLQPAACLLGGDPRLFEPAEHSEQRAAPESWVRVRLVAEEGVERAQRLVGRSRTPDECERKTEQARPTDDPRMGDRLLGCLCILLEAARAAGDVAKCKPDAYQAGVVFSLSQ
jgi:hypothetical protein